MEDTMKMNMQMNFHWGNEATILFKGWPNESTGMYILALLFVFVLAFAMEALSAWPVVKSSMNPIVAGITHASIYSVRICMGYLVMLAVMSFNAGIFIVAVAGHTFGYFIVKASALALAKPAASPA
ncbi:copper transporter 1-like [Pyrus x bretschneideri]|uniref:copper transporter 1-like n=1 Tax=Pyrus x bretschneideri TaxID=225117 RepID=UPI0005112930|nr:copper transporter 1-like [Pyrus x bretschneideri]